MALARLRRVRWGFEAVAVYGRAQSWPLSTYVRRCGKEAAAEALCNEVTVARFVLQLRAAFQKLRGVSSSEPLCSLVEECEPRDAGCVLHTVSILEGESGVEAVSTVALVNDEREDEVHRSVVVASNERSAAMDSKCAHDVRRCADVVPHEVVALCILQSRQALLLKFIQRHLFVELP